MFLEPPQMVDRVAIVDPEPIVKVGFSVADLGTEFSDRLLVLLR